MLLLQMLCTSLTEEQGTVERLSSAALLIRPQHDSALHIIIIIITNVIVIVIIITNSIIIIIVYLVFGNRIFLGKCSEPLFYFVPQSSWLD